METPKKAVNLKLENKSPSESLSAAENENTLTVRTMKSLRGWASSSKNLASQVIIEVPIVSFRKIRKKKGVGSVYRETKHFSGTTSMHGPKRIFFGKGVARIFWLLIVLSAFAMLIFQTVVLLQMYFSKPILSQVSFIVNEGGMEFPVVTICNFNPIKKSYVRVMNDSHDLTSETLEYLLQTNMDTMFLYSNLNRTALRSIHEEAEVYFGNHSVRIIEFLKVAGYGCEEMFKICYFRGEKFNCCDYMEPRVTSYGKCYQLNLQKFAPKWMWRQISPGVEAGLQIIADGLLDEELNGEEGDADPIFSTLYENGFRFFIHPQDTNPELASEGISVSPSRIVYSALKTTTHNLLERDQWGNCTTTWPDGYNTSLPYSATACRYLCIAQYFQDNCNCAPFTYNIDGQKRICSPYETVTCMDQYMIKQMDGKNYLDFPACSECHMECESKTYNSYNSYGDGFNKGALNWLRKKEKTNTTHIKENMAIINIFFLEMFYTSYSQVAGTSLTEILSDIGGNMGMFLGMSVITITELSLFFSKIFWIMFSKKRREYMFTKKTDEETKEQHIDEAVKEFQEKKSRRGSKSSLKKFAANDIAPSFFFDYPDRMEYKNSESSYSNSSLESMVEFKLDANELRHKLSEQASTDSTIRLRIPQDENGKTKATSDEAPVFVIEPPTAKNSVV